MKYRLKSLACVASLLIYINPAMADDNITPESLELKVTRPGDLEMSCSELSQEAFLMKEIVATTQDIKDKSEIQKHGITAVGAVGSFLVGTVTGGIGLAAAGFLLDQNVDEKSEDADSVQDVAEQRRSLMMGIFKAKDCEGPLEYAMVDPEPSNIFELASIEPASGEEVGHSYRHRVKPHYNE